MVGEEKNGRGLVVGKEKINGKCDYTYAVASVESVCPVSSTVVVEFWNGIAEY